MDEEMNSKEIHHDLHRYPFCLIWTPIPLITWLFPFIGHMGIASSEGIIRDFAGPYVVSKDDMGFGWPTRYIQLDAEKVEGGSKSWDDAVDKASSEYCKRMHNLFWDNCHSHCGMALSLMQYSGSTSWNNNMICLAAWMFFFGKYVSVMGFVKTWLPFTIIAVTIYLVYYFT